MKKLLFILFVCTSIVSYAQTFEGTMKWSIESEITDPATKAQLENAQKQMADPDMQAKMKEALEQMNNPEMKKMMEGNPQMKAQMENAMKIMQGGAGAMRSIMPTGATARIKGGSILTKIEGGIMSNTETLYNKTKNESYIVNRKSKTYAALTDEAKQTDDKQKAVVTKTGETTKILGYTCRKYIVGVTEGGQTVNQILWTTTEIAGLDFKAMMDTSTDSPIRYYEGVEGVPLKTEMSTPQVKIVMVVKEVKKESIPASEFVIPAGFQKVPLLSVMK